MTSLDLVQLYVLSNCTTSRNNNKKLLQKFIYKEFTSSSSSTMIKASLRNKVRIPSLIWNLSNISYYLQSLKNDNYVLFPSSVFISSIHPSIYPSIYPFTYHRTHTFDINFIALRYIWFVINTKSNIKIYSNILPSNENII